MQRYWFLIFLSLFFYMESPAQSAQDYIRANAIPLQVITSIPDSLLSHFDPYRVIMVGELHGTREPVSFASALAQALVKRGDSVLLGFEIPEEHLVGFRESRTVKALAATRFFQGSTHDGRGNRSWFDALSMALADSRMEVFFFDNTDAARYSSMALRIATAHARHPNWRMVTISGNIHNRRTGFKGEQRAAGYLPILSPDLEGKVGTINLSFAHAEMYNNTGNGLERQKIDNIKSDYVQAAPSDHYLLFYSSGKYTYDVILFVKNLSAAELMYEKK